MNAPPSLHQIKQQNDADKQAIINNNCVSLSDNDENMM